MYSQCLQRPYPYVELANSLFSSFCVRRYTQSSGILLRIWHQQTIITQGIEWRLGYRDIVAIATTYKWHFHGTYPHQIDI